MTKEAMVIITLPPEEAMRYAHAIADISCWVKGFEAAGGSVSPVDMSGLRELKRIIHSQIEHKTVL